LLAPESYDRFFDEVVGRKMLHLHEGDSARRAGILGEDPAGAILGAYDDLAHTITCHSGSATKPPPRAKRVASPAEFRALIRKFHELEYTVRIPEVTALSPELKRLCRALEVLFENPASPGIFWSAAGANAPVHHDEVDLICIQLTGRKRWFISTDPPTLPNMWKVAGEGAPPLEQHHVIDVVPGDVIYMPRGTAHTVQSTTESIHISIGFLPVTVREAMNAVVDYFSELERSIRSGITDRADDLSHGRGTEQVTRRVCQGLKNLLARCESGDFVRDAMERRRARMIEDLPKIGANGAGRQIRPESRVRHHPLAVAHVLATGEVADFRQPGERILVHRGAENALRYIVQTPEFRVADIPGPLGDDVKVALVSRLVMSGFLEHTP
jgi:ribosomal protein L16 Arg81 hydroxylase